MLLLLLMSPYLLDVCLKQVDVGPTEYKNKDMLEALENHKSSKPRAAEWLLSFIEKIYKVLLSTSCIVS